VAIDSLPLSVLYAQAAGLKTDEVQAVRFVAYLAPDPDNVSHASLDPIPLSSRSLFYTLNANDRSYLRVVCSDFDKLDEIKALIDGKLQLDAAFTMADGTVVDEQEFVLLSGVSFYYDIGPKSRTLTLAASSTFFTAGGRLIEPAVLLGNGVNSDGDAYWRIPPYYPARPGDVLKVEGTEYTIGTSKFFASATRSTLEVSE
jgi:hypothetical protein